MILAIDKSFSSDNEIVRFVENATSTPSDTKGLAITENAAIQISYKKDKDENPDKRSTFSVLAMDYMGFVNIWTSKYYADVLRELANIEEIAGIICTIHTPGGVVEGAIEMYQAIEEFRASGKVFIARCHNALSAGLWIASAADEIHLVSEASSVGSFGVMTSVNKEFVEYAKANIEDIKSKISPDKNKTYEEVKEGDYSSLQARVDEIALLFMKDLNNARPEIKDEALTGKVYSGVKAIEMGLADIVCSHYESVDRLKMLYAINM